jgi:predicted metal-dependent hydrolase
MVSSSSKPRQQVRGRLAFCISKKKEIEEILWTFSHLSSLRRWASKIVLPPFSKLLTRRLQSLVRRKSSLEPKSEMKLDQKTYALFIKEFNLLYNRKQYQNTLNFVERKWRRIECQFFKTISSMSNLRVRRRYICYLTFYGGGGSFGRNNQIYVRVNPKIKSDRRFANYTIIHELIHLMLEPYATKHGFSQEEKEHAVESIVKSPPIRKPLK